MEGEHLTKPATINFEDSNIALLGSDLEARVRAEAGEHEPAWQAAELGNLGTLVWRVENFRIKPWPKDRYGEFFSGDSYIVLHTYKRNPNEDSLSYDLHFWLGEETTQDEAGTAAYKTAELDDVLHGIPVEYREVMGHESSQFLSYFKRFITLRGGVASGFHHVGPPPVDETRRLYRIHAQTTAHPAGKALPVVVREVDIKAPGAIEAGDAYVLDMGKEVWQLNTVGAVGREKFKAAELAKTLADHPDRRGLCDVHVFDQGSPGAGKFLAAVGVEAPQGAASPLEKSVSKPQLYRLTNSDGFVEFAQVESTGSIKQNLSSADAYIIDCTSSKVPVIWAWIGSQASSVERRLVLEYAQRYLREHKVQPRTAVVKVLQGHEPAGFEKAIETE